MLICVDEISSQKQDKCIRHRHRPEIADTVCSVRHNNKRVCVYERNPAMENISQQLAQVQTQNQQLMLQNQELMARLAEKDDLIQKLTAIIEHLTTLINKNMSATSFYRRRPAQSNPIIPAKTSDKSKRAHDDVSSQGTDEDCSLADTPEPTGKQAKKKNKKAQKKIQDKRQEDYPKLPEPVAGPSSQLHNRFDAFSSDNEDVIITSQVVASTQHAATKDNSDEDMEFQPSNRPANNRNTPSRPPPPSDQPETTKIPPVTLQDKTKWDFLTAEFRRTGIQFSHARNLNEGIKIQFSTIDSFRSATKLLRNANIGFFTYTTQDEAKLRVVLRGIPEHYTGQEIKEDLEDQGFHPENVFRMHKNNKPIPLMLAILPREEKEIFNIRSVKQFIIKVEAQRPRASIGQCHRCQRFGHAQRNCTLPPRCVKCAENHHHADPVRQLRRGPSRILQRMQHGTKATTHHITGN